MCASVSVEHSLSHYTRILQEVVALRASGATVVLLTSNANTPDEPQDILRTEAPVNLAMGHPRIPTLMEDCSGCPQPRPRSHPQGV